MCLKVGLRWSSALAQRLSLPFVGVHHMMAHALVARMDHPQLAYPFVALLISGGHTELWLMHSQSQGVVLAETADDAVGEAYDKVARTIGLQRLEGQSPGAAVERMAALSTQPRRFTFPQLKHDNPEFSFAGIKAAVLREVLQLRADRPPLVTNESAGTSASASASASAFPSALLHRNPDGRLSNRSISLLVDELRSVQGTVRQAVHEPSATPMLNQLGTLSTAEQHDLCAGFQSAVCEQLSSRVLRALEYCAELHQRGILAQPVHHLVVGGGVACNRTIRRALEQACGPLGVAVLAPRPLHCMDNGIMIGYLGSQLLQQGHSDAYDLGWHTRWPIGPKRSLPPITVQEQRRRKQATANEGRARKPQVTTGL